MKTTSRRPSSSRKPSKKPGKKSAKSTSADSKRPVKGHPQKNKAAKKAKRSAPAASPRAAPAQNERARTLAHLIAKLALDKKAVDVLILDVRGMTSYADYFVIASGESDRQVSALGEHIEITLKNLPNDPQRVIGSEGRETGNWVLLDYGEVVAHLFLSDQRSFYDLEGLWADARRESVTA